LSGYPVPENPKIIRNWTHEESDYITDERVAKEEVINSKCRIYRGTYLLSSSALFTFDDFTGIGVACKCPAHEYLDRNCRRLKPCLNNGHRSFDSSLYCICPKPYFGEQCEKYCDQGQRMTGADGRDYCSCTPFYQGEECRNIVCLNGGTELRHQCLC
uniref:EGF-like domain-containing protein n=1 Tax=Brugia timori TaxID=42155 RepID=A0A0R3Q853_9BILA